MPDVKVKTLNFKPEELATKVEILVGYTDQSDSPVGITNKGMRLIDDTIEGIYQEITLSFTTKSNVNAEYLEQLRKHFSKTMNWNITKFELKN